ncbi:hypothetical protein L596_024197 [Steinernema carpocapsae]|uniref:Uncharacterized protein n=1 Tax=Steinernema carpocapsae TaxID=34508 RepID=A0A4U5MG17_STECR|nr:hypothetical protein L596_024197 [Steinernema carpocapsae]
MILIDLHIVALFTDPVRKFRRANRDRRPKHETLIGVQVNTRPGGRLSREIIYRLSAWNVFWSWLFGRVSKVGGKVPKTEEVSACLHPPTNKPSGRLAAF